MKLQLPDYSQVTVLVAGDTMLDRYWTGSTQRISPEAPVPVVKVDTRDERPGGAGNVALNITSLGARAMVIGLTGDDEAGTLLAAKLGEQRNITSHLHKLHDKPTITKLRVLSRHQQLLRLDFEQGFDAADSQLLLSPFSELLAQAQVVILSDYGKGTLIHAPAFIQQALAHKVPVLIDPKNPDFSHYRGATLVTPNMMEFQAAVGTCNSEQDIATRGENLMAQHGIEALLVTRSEQGMSLLRHQQAPLHIPAQARDVFDVTGAGDTVIAVLATSLAAGLPLEQAAQTANLAAGIVVGRLGAASVSVPELRRAFHDLHSAEQNVVDENELMVLIEDARAHGETIVMTNGCFDILHAGHVSYLEQAAKLGDRLIIAVNDDASIGRLKGPNRPIVPLAERMKVLAGLEAVDWVVAFSEDTPERLICAVQPDILVKGGDYQVETIAGNQCAGDTRVLHYLPGLSTSDIIDKITRKTNQQ